MTFINALAWIFGTMSLLLLVARLLALIGYSERDRLLDRMRGEEYTFPLTTPGIVVIVCGAWLLWGGA